MYTICKKTEKTTYGIFRKDTYPTVIGCKLQIQHINNLQI